MLHIRKNNLLQPLSHRNKLVQTEQSKLIQEMRKQLQKFQQTLNTLLLEQDRFSLYVQQHCKNTQQNKKHDKIDDQCLMTIFAPETKPSNNYNSSANKQIQIDSFQCSYTEEDKKIENKENIFENDEFFIYKC